MGEYFAMGGHAAYVWTSYAVALAVLVGMLALSLGELRRSEALLRTLDAARPARRRARRADGGDAAAAVAASAGADCAADGGGGNC